MARHRSKITEKGHRAGVANANKGKRFFADTYTREEVLALVEQCNVGPSGLRDRALIVTLWRTGLRISEALGLGERQAAPLLPLLDPPRGPMRTNPTRFVPLSVRYGNRRKRAAWWLKNRRHDIALRIAPWLDTGTLPPRRFDDKPPYRVGDRPYPPTGKGLGC